MWFNFALNSWRAVLISAKLYEIRFDQRRTQDEMIRSFVKLDQVINRSAYSDGLFWIVRLQINIRGPFSSVVPLQARERTRAPLAEERVRAATRGRCSRDCESPSGIDRSRRPRTIERKRERRKCCGAQAQSRSPRPRSRRCRVLLRVALLWK